MLAAVAAVAGATGCDGSTYAEMSREAQVYVATIREVADEQPPAEPDVLPVVYVISIAEEEIAADVQAEVAAALNDDVEVRFADDRSETVLEDEANIPVRDDGVLLALGALATEGESVAMVVEVYRSDADWSRRVLTIARGSSQWTVTESSVVPADDA